MESGLTRNWNAAAFARLLQSLVSSLQSLLSPCPDASGQVKLPLLDWGKEKVQYSQLSPISHNSERTVRAATPKCKASRSQAECCETWGIGSRDSFFTEGEPPLDTGLKTGASALLIVLTLVSTVRAADMPPPKSEETERLLALVRELDARKDTEGLLLALQAAQGLPRRDQGVVIYRIIAALRKADIEKLKSEASVDALGREVEKGFAGAVGLLARIGTERARRIIASAARSNPNQQVRHYALGCLGTDPESIEILLKTAAELREKQNQDCRCVALQRLEQLPLEEEQYRLLLEAYIGAPEDSLAEPVLILPGRKRDPVAIGPLLGALGKLSSRMEEMEGKKDTQDAAKEKKEKETILKCYGRGMASLHAVLDYASKSVGYQIVFGEHVSVAKGGKEVMSYIPRAAEKDPAERRRVLVFWTVWLAENKQRLPGAPTPPRVIYTECVP